MGFAVQSLDNANREKVRRPEVVTKLHGLGMRPGSPCRAGIIKQASTSFAVSNIRWRILTDWKIANHRARSSDGIG